jgi:hypothetical protein
MLTKDQTRQRWRELRDLVNSADPAGLVGMGSPLDEYECLVGPVMRLLEQRAPHEAIVAFLTGEFREHFGVEVPDTVIVQLAAATATWHRTQWSQPNALPQSE